MTHALPWPGTRAQTPAGPGGGPGGPILILTTPWLLVVTVVIKPCVYIVIIECQAVGTVMLMGSTVIVVLVINTVKLPMVMASVPFPKSPMSSSGITNPWHCQGLN